LITQPKWKSLKNNAMFENIQIVNFLRLPGGLGSEPGIFRFFINCLINEPLRHSGSPK
jgi:hypothetical protein